MEESLNKNLESKGYGCACECYFHQIKKLGIKEESIPNLKNEKRVGVMRTLVVTNRKIEDRDKPIEKVESETTIFKKCWYESLGYWGKLIVIMEKSERIINSAEEIESNLDDIIRFVHGRDKTINEYNRKIILVGIKSLFEMEKISCWDKVVYFLYDTGSTGTSAGVPLLLAFYSAFFKIGIPDNLSATGEINTEDGSVKEIGGLKEKFVCVFLSKEVNSLILPKENYEHVLEILNACSKRFVDPKKVNLYSVSNCKVLVEYFLQSNK